MNGRRTFIDDTDGIAWVRDVHVPTLPAGTRSVVLWGNEDCPDRVDAYRKVAPTVDERPAVFLSDDAGTLRRATLRTFHGVRYVARGRPAPAGFVRCGTCGRAWDDETAPAGRCPFEGMRGH